MRPTLHRACLRSAAGRCARPPCQCLPPRHCSRPGCGLDAMTVTAVAASWAAGRHGPACAAGIVRLSGCWINAFAFVEQIRKKPAPRFSIRYQVAHQSRRASPLASLEPNAMQPLASIAHHGADAPPPPPQPTAGAAGSHAGMPWLHSDRPQQQLLHTTAPDLPGCGDVGVDGKHSQQLHHGAIAPPASAAGGRNTAAGPPLAPDAPGQQSTRSAPGMMTTATVAPSSLTATTSTRPGYASLNVLNIRLSEEPAAGADDSLTSLVTPGLSRCWKRSRSITRLKNLMLPITRSR